MGYKVNPPSTEELRKLAIQRLGIPLTPVARTLSAEQAHKLLEEVAISKIEAEIQNEYLQDTCSRLDLALKEVKDLYESAPLGCISMDATGKITQLNLMAAKMLGQERHLLMGCDFTDFVTTETRELIHTLMQRAALAGEEQQCSLSLQSTDGQVRYVKLSLSAPTRGDGHLLSLTDISAQKAVEDVVRDREARSRFALECSGVGVWEWDVRSGLATYSATLTQLYGCSVADFGNTMDAWRERVHPDDWTDFLAALRRCLSGQETALSWVHRATCADGSTQWLRCTGAVFGRDERGVVTHMLGTLTEITDQKRLEEELVHKGSVLRAVFESLPHYMAVLDGNARVLETNALWNTYALSVGRAYHNGYANVHFSVLLDAVSNSCPELKCSLMASVTDVLSGHAPSAHLEYSFLSGLERRWFVMNVMTVRDGYARVVVSHQDVTHFKTGALPLVPNASRRSG